MESTQLIRTKQQSICEVNTQSICEVNTQSICEVNTQSICIKQQYIDSLSKKEKKAYDIAVQHLGSSFTLEKSIGFLEWIQNK